MGKIHLNRNRQSLGQFSPEEVSAGLKSGRFLSSDLGWQEGMEAWKPLSDFTDLPPPSEETAPPPIEGALPGMPVAFPSESAPAVLEPQPSWERRQDLGMLKAIVETVKEVLGRPAETFQRMPATGGLAQPMLFYVITGTITWSIAVIYQAILAIANPASLGEHAKDMPMGVLIGIYAGFIVIMPLFVILHSFIAAGVWHLCLLLLGAGKSGFEATYRVVCYAAGSTSVFLLIPLCGGLVQFVWSMVAVVIGFKQVHRTETMRAAAAALIPVVLCCACAIAIYTAAIASLVSAAGAAGPGPR